MKTITFSGLKKLVAESLDYHRCYRCGRSRREDYFGVPGFLNDYIIPDHERKLWREFLESNWDKITALGLDSSKYNRVEPVCDECCRKIQADSRFAALSDEWETVKSDSLGGDGEVAELKALAAKIGENTSVLKDAVKNELEKWYYTKDERCQITAYRTRYGSKESVGHVGGFPVMRGDDDELGWIKSKKDSESPIPVVLKLVKYGFVWSESKHREIDLGIDLMTADKDQVRAAVEKRGDEIRRFL